MVPTPARITNNKSPDMMNSKKLAPRVPKVEPDSPPPPDSEDSIKKQALLRHELLMSKQFTCETCNAKFDRNEDLLRSHLNIESECQSQLRLCLPCAHCPVTFNNYALYSQHSIKCARQNGSVTKWSACIHCPSTFRSRSDYFLHLAIKHPDNVDKRIVAEMNRSWQLVKPNGQSTSHDPRNPVTVSPTSTENVSERLPARPQIHKASLPAKQQRRCQPYRIKYKRDQQQYDQLQQQLQQHKKTSVNGGGAIRLKLNKPSPPQLLPQQQQQQQQQQLLLQQHQQPQQQQQQQPAQSQQQLACFCDQNCGGICMAASVLMSIKQSRGAGDESSTVSHESFESVPAVNPVVDEQYGVDVHEQPSELNEQRQGEEQRDLLDVVELTA